MGAPLQGSRELVGKCEKLPPVTERNLSKSGQSLLGIQEGEAKNTGAIEREEKNQNHLFSQLFPDYLDGK